MHDGDGDSFQVIEERTIPDVYADSVRFELSVYGMTLEFGQMQKPRAGAPGPAPHLPKIRVHMSPQHAKVMARLFIKNMREYESKIGPLAIPPDVLRELGIEDES